MFNFRPKMPWLHVRPERLESDWLGFRVNSQRSPLAGWDAIALNGDAYSPGGSVLPLVQTSGSTFGSGSSGDNPDELNWYVLGDSPVAPSEIEAYTPDGISPPPAQIEEPQSSDPGVDGTPLPQTSVPGYRIEFPDDVQRYSVPADGGRPDTLMATVGTWPFDVKSGPLKGRQPGSAFTGSYINNFPAYDSAYFPEPLPDPIKQALDEIARIYGLNRFQPTGLFNRSTSIPASTKAGDDYPSSDALEPRQIPPANAPQQLSPPRNPSGSQQLHGQQPRGQQQSPDRQQPYHGNKYDNAPGPSQDSASASWYPAATSGAEAEAAARAAADAARALAAAQAKANAVTIAVMPTPVAPPVSPIQLVGDYTGKAAQLVDILMPGGQPIGTVARGATVNIRTVTSAEFGSLASDLLTGAYKIETPPNYGVYLGRRTGQYYQRADGSVVGLRWAASGPTFDVVKSNTPLIGTDFKVHQAPVRVGP